MSLRAQLLLMRNPGHWKISRKDEKGPGRGRQVVCIQGSGDHWQRHSTHSKCGCHYLRYSNCQGDALFPPEPQTRYVFKEESS